MVSRGHFFASGSLRTGVKASANEECHPVSWTGVRRKRPPCYLSDVGTVAGDEQRWTAGLRDLVGGLLLLAIGVATGGSSLAAAPDALDYLFDVAGLLWASWGLVRIVLGR